MNQLSSAMQRRVVREHVRSVAALAHLRPADVHEGWMALMEVCPNEEFQQLVMFNDYFVETWLGDDAKISMDMWSVYTETERRTIMLRDGTQSS